jgi:hypothetical protein
MGLSAELKALGSAVAPPDEGFQPEGLPRFELCPRLKTTYSPRVTWQDWRGFGIEPERDRKWARVWIPDPPGPELGSSLARNSNQPPRYGLKGLPGTGRRSVWRALALLEERRELLSFWTVTLPTAALTALARLGTWPVFQDRLRQELIQRLRRKGLPPMVVGVAELQPKRSRAEGRPCPHLHVVFQGRKARKQPWALNPADLDGVIRAALTTAGVTVPPGIEGQAWLQSAGNVQRVKKSVRAYLSKYMTKGSGDVKPWVGGPWESLLPRQWWFWSAPLRAFVLEHVLPMAFRFIAWVHANRKEIEAQGHARFRLLPLTDPRAPMTFEVGWISTGRLAHLIYLWQTDEWDEQWFAAERVRKAGLSECWLPAIL